MLRLHGILGTRTDPLLAQRLHRHEHAGTLECLFVAEADLSRRRLRQPTDRGTDCAISLSREESLFDGAVLCLDEQRAVVVRAGEPHELWLMPRDMDAAVKLGWHAGNLHWRVRFDSGLLVVVMDGPRDDYLARLAPLLGDGSVKVVSAQGAGGAHGPA